MKTNKLLAIGLATIFSAQLNAQEMDKEESNVTVSSSVLIEAPIEKVWEVIAEEFADIGIWFSGVSHSEGFGVPAGDSPYSIRACKMTTTGLDTIKEEITEFDKENYLLRYALFDGLPLFVKNAENIWKLEGRDEGTFVTCTTKMRVTGVLGFATKGMMRRTNRKALESMTEEVKHYIETGQPHPDKVAWQEKIAKKDARKRKK